MNEIIFLYTTIALFIGVQWNMRHINYRVCPPCGVVLAPALLYIMLVSALAELKYGRDN